MFILLLFHFWKLQNGVCDLSSGGKDMDIYQQNYDTQCSLLETEVAHFKYPKRNAAAFVDKKGDEKVLAALETIFCVPPSQFLNLISALSSYLTSCQNIFLCFHLNSGLQMKLDFHSCLMTGHPQHYILKFKSIVAGNLTF